MALHRFFITRIGFVLSTIAIASPCASAASSTDQYPQYPDLFVSSGLSSNDVSSDATSQYAMHQEVETPIIFSTANSKTPAPSASSKGQAPYASGKGSTKAPKSTKTSSPYYYKGGGSPAPYRSSKGTGTLSPSSPSPHKQQSTQSLQTTAPSPTTSGATPSPSKTAAILQKKNEDTPTSPPPAQSPPPGSGGPANDGLSRMELAPYNIIYTLPRGRIPTKDEAQVVIVATNGILQRLMISRVGNPPLEDFTTISSKSQFSLGGGSPTYRIDYQSTAHFASPGSDSSSQGNRLLLPTREDMDKELVQIIESGSYFIELRENLPNDNLFKRTESVQVENSKDAANGNGALSFPNDSDQGNEVNTNDKESNDPLLSVNNLLILVGVLCGVSVCMGCCFLGYRHWADRKNQVGNCDGESITPEKDFKSNPSMTEEDHTFTSTPSEFYWSEDSSQDRQDGETRTNGKDEEHGALELKKSLSDFAKDSQRGSLSQGSSTKEGFPTNETEEQDHSSETRCSSIYDHPAREEILPEAQETMPVSILVQQQREHSAQIGENEQT